MYRSESQGSTAVSRAVGSILRQVREGVSATRTPRAALAELAYALSVLHQRLLAATQVDFEKMYGRIEGPGALLQLVVNDPLFAWLRPLSRQMAQIDEIASDEVDGAAWNAARESVARLIDEPSDFRATYLVYLQSHPDVVIAHAELRRLVPSSSRSA